MWTIKEKELATKKELSKMSLLESLIERKESLTESEETLKNKLITDLLSREWTVLAMTGHGSGQVRGVDHWLPVGEVRGVCSLLSV
ncbi:hypothetical protein YC2023_028231 [Brassica napus]